MATHDAHAEHDKDFHKDFYRMSNKVDQLFAGYQAILEKKKVKIEGDASGNEGSPPKPSSPYSSSSSSSSSSHSHHSNKHKKGANKRLVKIYVKFYLPIFNGEFNGEKLDN